jgi:antitoxin component YwqK of YwqJK toxin-antitoxin module
MKRTQRNYTLVALVIVIWLVLPSVSFASSDTAMKVYVEDKEIAFDAAAQPLLIGNTAMVPFRPIFEAFGFSVKWDAETQTVTGIGNLMMVQLRIGSNDALINGKSAKLPMAPRLIESSAYIPLRFIGEATGREVIWDGEEHSVKIGPARDPVTYEGELKDGLPEGKGKLYLNGVLLYEGDFHHGLPDGEGKKYYANGKLMYEGGFVRGAMEGKGKLYREDGTLWYDAQFEHNEINGPGTWYYDYGHRLVGQFKHGVPDGPGKYYRGDGTLSFVGTWVNGTRNGFGTEYYANGNKFFEGQMAFSNPVEGKLYYEDGTLKYEGKLDENYAPNGTGTLYKMDGTVYFKGTFSHGKPVTDTSTPTSTPST